MPCGATRPFGQQPVGRLGRAARQLRISHGRGRYAAALHGRSLGGAAGADPCAGRLEGEVLVQHGLPSGDGAGISLEVLAAQAED